MQQPAEENKKPASGAAPLAREQQGLSIGPRKRPRTIKRRKGKVAVSEDHVPGATQSGLDASLYINRELSWLEFNQRVIEEARDPRHPLLERVKFLSIVSTNLDEFFMIRVAAIKEQILADFVDYSPDGRVPIQQHSAIHERVERMVQEMSACFWTDLHPRLKASGVHLLKMDELSEEERRSVSDLFAREIFPVLTPLAFDPGHPFPYISNLSLSLAAVVRTPQGEERFARVKVPDVLPRLVQIPSAVPGDPTLRFVWLEDLIANNLGILFPGMEVKESYAFRVTRNADIEIQEDEAEDLIHSIEESIRLRRFGSVVRVGVESTMPQRIKDILVENLEVTQDDVYQITPPLGLGHLMALMKAPRPDLKDPPLSPTSLAPEDEADDMFSLIRRGDIALHHPYDSFAPVVQFLTTAVKDPNVLAIKQTLYRIGKESPLVPLFIEAAENGKQVAVLVELKARFDEENNIIWAKQLERAGVHVVYGLVGLKTHAKMALVVRRESDGLRRYAHLGTGNYNPATARIYTDFSYFTSREEITNDVSEVFNYLTGYSKRESYARLAVAPVTLRERLTGLIDREIGLAKQGKEARLVFKMNSLTDPKMILKLYEASRAGVKIDLIVRGICCLRPGLVGVSENIRVISIVGRFLEHSRVFYCLNDGSPELYLSSADLMGRNLDRRVELMFPIEHAGIAESIRREALDLPLRDTVRARQLTSDGTYRRVTPPDGEEGIDCQAVPILTRGTGSKYPRPVPREAPPTGAP
jgi:polyphosphate kinase